MSETKSADFTVKSIKQVFDRKVFPLASKIFAEGQPGTCAHIILRSDMSILREIQNGQATSANARQARANVRGACADGQRAAHSLSATGKGFGLMSITQDKPEKKFKEAGLFVRYWIKYISRCVIDLFAPETPAA